MYVRIFEKDYKGNWVEDGMSNRNKDEVKIGDVITFHVSYGYFQDYVVREIKGSEAFAYQEGLRYRLDDK